MEIQLSRAMKLSHWFDFNDTFYAKQEHKNIFLEKTSKRQNSIGEKKKPDEGEIIFLNDF